MKVEDLQNYFEEAGSGKIRFEGNCHDCGTPVCVNADLEDDGNVIVDGGALFNPWVDSAERKLFFKCDSCFKKDSTLKDYRPCLVYSRIVGYLRPVKDWNDAKQGEFNQRKAFKIDEET